MVEELKAQIEEHAQMLAKEISVEIFEVTVRPVRDGLAVVVIADLEHGGIALDQCTHINQRLAQWIEEEAIIVEDYTLEVNSPGLDNPLKTWRDFNRVTGRNVRFYLKEKVEEKLEHFGKVTSVDEKEVQIETKNASFGIPIDLINKALQEIS